jgi:hypothetical protein
MTKSLYAVVFGAGLLLAGSLGASAQSPGIFDTQRDCASDIQSLCPGVKPGGGRVLACLQSHVAAGNLSVGCSTILSKMIWVAKECGGDIRQFCPNITFENLGDCMRPHLSETSGPCQAAMAFIASPAGDRY